MSKFKYQLLFWILFITVGFSLVTTNLLMNGSTSILSNKDDFLVYFSDVLVNGNQDLSLVKNSKELVFLSEFSSVGDKVVIDYDITNASKIYDAEVSISCTGGNNYLKVVNTFDQTANLPARSTRTGTLTVKLINAVSTELSYEIQCIITGTAVERESEGSGSVNAPVVSLNTYDIGDEVIIGSEKFNVIKDNGDTITMLAQYNLGTNYRQSTTKNKIMFSNSAGWEYTPGPRDIDIQQYDGPTKTYLNEYVSYLKIETNDFNLSGDLISLAELNQLGCTILWDYSYNNAVTCSTSAYTEWLISDQQWWTKSAYPGNSLDVWVVNSDNQLNYVNTHDNAYSIRPIITVLKEAL